MNENVISEEEFTCEEQPFIIFSVTKDETMHNSSKLSKLSRVPQFSSSAPPLKLKISSSAGSRNPTEIHTQADTGAGISVAGED
ncbi:hypothetical protein, partial [Litorimonas sp.]|uniref:hypothetical protein n=1 Tax=Litorimonas sp. TaxID=1892381 RepID=UPI003A8A8BC7